MPPRLRGTLAPQCSSCLRRCLDEAFGSSSLPIRQQARGAKVKTAPWHQPASTVVVQLNVFVDSWGKKGAYVAAPAGLMRNKWLPRNWARYVTGDELKQLHERGATFERDTQAGGPNEARRRKKAERLEREAMAGAIDNVWKDDSKEARMGNLAGESSADAVKVTIEHVEPERAIQLLDALLPAKLEFERVVRKQDIRKDSVEPDKLAVRDDVIYGSVSIGDIIQSIRQAVSHNDEAARISMPDLQIKFLDLPDGETPTRVRRLGSFTIEIVQKGTQNVLQRTVNVVEEKEAPKETQTSNSKATELAAILEALRGPDSDKGAKANSASARQSSPQTQKQPEV